MSDQIATENPTFSATLGRMSSVQKPGRGAPPYSKWINRRAGRVIAAVAYVLGLTPNAVAVISAILTFSGLAIVALVAPQWWLGIPIALLLALGYAFGVSFARFGGVGPRAVLLIPLGYLTVSIVFFFGIMLAEQLRRRYPAPVAAPTSGARDGLFQTLVALPADYGILCIGFLAFGWRPAFLIVYCLLFIGHTVVLGGASVKWWRSLRALEAQPKP